MRCAPLGFFIRYSRTNFDIFMLSYLFYMKHKSMTIYENISAKNHPYDYREMNLRTPIY